uniref:Uncharacterized protein n=1 Tax=viral metagenome TaxID=1070528 RepID=A0A6C0LP87_9ZZZZ
MEDGIEQSTSMLLEIIRKTKEKEKEQEQEKEKRNNLRFIQ